MKFKAVLLLSLISGSVVADELNSASTEQNKTTNASTPLASDKNNQTLTLAKLAPPETSIEAASAEDYLKRLQLAIKNLNFEASFIVINNNSAEPYKWIHGIHNGVELEHLSLLNGAGQDIVRKGNVVSYYTPQQAPYSVKSNVIRGPLPNILFGDISDIASKYRFVLAGKKRIAGRAAQLVRIIPNDTNLFNYHLWLDATTGMILRASYVSLTGKELEPVQFTHLKVTEKPSPDVVKLFSSKLPPTNMDNANIDSAKVRSDRWNFGWLPKGFELVKSDQHHLALTRELSEYYMFSDGLIDFSVFIQRPMLDSENSVNTIGATTLYNYHTDSYDVSVVGKLPARTAQMIAQAIRRP